MLNHLDDPNPHTFPGDFRARVDARARSIQARRRVTTLGTAVLAVLVLGAGGLYARALTRVDDVARITVAGTGEPAGDGRTILIAGVDRDLGGPVVRTDTLLVVHFGAGEASVLSIPRDLAVPAPDGAEQVRINTIAADHGYATLLQVLADTLGIDVDNVVEVDFNGFARLVDLVGGIDVQTTAPLRDQMTGLAIESAGCHRLDGMDALALARSRHLQHLSDGQWRTDPTGDLGRINRQPALLTAGLQALTRTRPDPLTADRLAGWLVDHATVDDSLDTAQLLGLLRSVLELEPADVSFGTLPVEAVTLDNGAAVLQATEDTDTAVERWAAGDAGPVAVGQDLVLGCPDDTPDAANPIAVGLPAPPLAGPSLLGADFDLSAHQGQHVVVSFTATWCVPCVNDLPDLVDFAERHPDVVMVSVATEDRPTSAVDLFHDVGASWALLDDPDGELSRRFRFTGVPAYVIIEPDGTVGGTATGSLDIGQIEDLTR